MSRPLGIFSPFRLPLLRADERRALFCLDNDDRGCHGAALSVVGFCITLLLDLLSPLIPKPRDLARTLLLVDRGRLVGVRPIRKSVL